MTARPHYKVRYSLFIALVTSLKPLNGLLRQMDAHGNVFLRDFHQTLASHSTVPGHRSRRETFQLTY